MSSPEPAPAARVAGAPLESRHLSEEEKAGSPVVIVAARWPERDDEAKDAARQIAGALAVERPVAVVSLEETGNASSVFYDGIFPIHTVPAGRAGSGMRDALRLRSSDEEVLGELAAMELASPEGALAVLEALSPELILLAGLETLSVAAALAQEKSPSRRLALPLAGPARLLSSRRFGRLLGTCQQVICFTGQEQELVAGGLGPSSTTEVLCVTLDLPASAEAERRDLAGVTTDGEYLALLTSWGGEPSFEPTDHTAWRAAFGAVGLAELAAERWLVSAPTRSHEVPFPPTRFDAWRIMAGALATVDLRQPGPIGRECLESLSFGTPVVVPAGSAAASHVAASGGGLTYGDAGELVRAVRRLVSEPSLRAELSQKGRSWTAGRQTDPRRAAAELHRLVLPG